MNKNNKEQQVQMHISVPAEFAKRLKIHCATSGKTMSKFFRELALRELRAIDRRQAREEAHS